jgi:hypothetical protein
VALVDAERRIARLRRPGRQRREALRHQSERLRAAVSNADSQLQELDKRALRLRITPPDPNRGIRPRRSSSLGLDL